MPVSVPPQPPSHLAGMSWIDTHAADDCGVCAVMSPTCPECGADLSAAADLTRTHIPLAVRRDHGWIDVVGTDEPGPLRTVVVYTCTGASTAALTAATHAAALPNRGAR